MALTADQFAKALIAAGLLAADEVKAFWNSLPAGQKAKDGETFAKLLIEREKLTQFQAQELLSGSQAPLVLGDYVLLARIGAGGMGQVFKANHRRMKRLVAIKLLPAALTKDEAAIKRFEREVEAAAKLVHPNIVQAYDAGVQRGVWYLVMEYVEGRDLSAIVAAEGPLPVARAVDYIRQAARGLAYAHENGVVHRDIKPANLLLNKQGTVKILDMGLARFDDGVAAAQDGLTQSGQVMGTVDYMAPEQAFDTHHADARADIYSLGCTLYRLLTVQNMYDGETMVQKLMGHQSKPIPALAAQRQDVPANLIAIFERMVAKRPEDRFQTMTEVDAALGRLNASAATNTPPTPTQGSKYTSYFRSMTGQGAKPQPTSAGVASLTQAAATDIDGISPTVALASPQYSTDPVSDRSIQVARHNTPQPAVAGRPPLWRQPVTLAAVGLGGVVLLALGIWVIVRDKDGNVIGRMKVPEGGTATIQSTADGSKPQPITPIGSAPPPAKAPFDAAEAKAHQQAWADYLGMKVEPTNSIGVKMILIPPGEFLMGSTDEQVAAAVKLEEQELPQARGYIQRVERPQHRVVITKPFWLGATEVTIGQFRKFISAAKYTTDAEQLGFGNSNSKVLDDKVNPADKGRNWGTPGYPVTDDTPVSQVSWNDAVAYCQWLSSQEKAAYRLPTEAEWEYACRAGTTTLYSCGNDPGVLGDYAWFNKNGGRSARPVGNKRPSPFGLFDMHGNLREWCSDFYSDFWYQNSTVSDPTGPASGGDHSLRGGQWLSGASACRSASRAHSTPWSRDGTTGFRVVRVLDTSATTVNNFALEFDGQSSLVELPSLSLDATGPFTVEAVVCCPVNDRDMCLVSNYNGNDGIALNLSPDKLVGIVKFAPAKQHAPTAARKPDTERHHAALVFDGKTTIVYWDGTRVAFDSKDMGPPRANTIGLRIGASPKSFTPAFFAGTMDEVRISKIARYDASYKPQPRLDSDDHTLALYHCDEGTGDTLIDASGNGRHGKIVATKWVPADAAPTLPAPVEPNRRTAEWVFSKGGSVRIKSSDSQSQNITQRKDLPGASFHITQITLPSAANGYVLADADLQRFRELSELYLVAGNWSQLTAAGVAQFDATPKLNYLVLVGENKNAWQALTSIKRLQTLDLQGTRPTAEQIASLKSLPNLSTLSISFESLTIVESALQRIDELPSLKVLHVRISDAGLAPILKLSKLAELQLQGETLTDAGLERLGTMQNLRSIRLSKTKVSAAGVSALQNSLPNCNVQSDNVPEAPTAAPVAPNRRTAEWVLQKKGKLSIKTPGKPDAVIDQLDQLPTGDFKIFNVLLAASGQPNKTTPIELTDDELTEFSKLPGLDQLYLLTINWSKLSASGMARLGDIPSLRYLIIVGQNPDVEAWNAVLRLTNLTSLDLQSTGVTSQQVRSLRAMPNLKSLGLSFQKRAAAEANLVAVEELTNVETLVLNFTEMSDAILAIVGRLKHLKSLLLNNTSLTDAGLVTLKGLSNLTKLEVRGTKVTAVGVAELQRALLNCKIEWDDPAKATTPAPGSNK